jgi:CubicO group peptidase (beta-lactamase class C family)
MVGNDACVIPGAAVVVIRDGAVQFRHAYGLADLENRVPITPATNFRLASMTKQFIARAIEILGVPLDVPVFRDITVRHLLSHTSGLIDYESLESIVERQAPRLSQWQLSDHDVLRLLEQTDRTYFPPGTQYRYSNGGYVLLGLLIERESGISLESFLKREIFDPLGMHTTVMGAQHATHRAYGYALEGGRWVHHDQSITSATRGDGGIYSSIDDLEKWVASLDGRVLEHGWHHAADKVWHEGETAGFRNVIVRWPAERTTLIMLSNRNHWCGTLFP